MHSSIGRNVVGPILKDMIIPSMTRGSSQSVSPHNFPIEIGEKPPDSRHLLSYLKLVNQQ